ncbi:hypothetical protein BSK48_22535 [Paenibacillus odorifer]|uniref:hypothetical protein n=1 Tax=Paenibacillus odorifer TaxID=189426 RepID=UPI00096D6276|nr:hypothetical protein [Paenibacillus odorifer]OMD65704.1 hypothetical protein BSK48_22535 [Paenibacillus odorifer]
MRYYCVELDGTVKSVRYGPLTGCIWLRVYGSSEMDRVDLHMVDSMWKSAHGGLHVEICSWWTPCGNLLMMGTPLYSSLQFSMSKSDEIIALYTLKIACTAEIIHISVFCATIFSEYGLAAGLANL